MGGIKLTKEQKHYRKIMNKEAKKGRLKDKYGRKQNKPFNDVEQISEILRYIIIKLIYIIGIIGFILFIISLLFTEYYLNF